MSSYYNKVKKFTYLINILKKIVKIIPKPLLNFTWVLFDSTESKFAILFRYLYLTKYCEKAGENIFVGKNVNLKNIKYLSIGSNVSIHSFNYIDAYGGITIGDNVSIANHCTLISSDHTWDDESIPIKYNEIVKKPIDIKDDVWIAAGCRILGNVTIHNRIVVGAGAVVNKNLEMNSLYVGIPVKKIKGLNEEVSK